MTMFYILLFLTLSQNLKAFDFYLNNIKIHFHPIKKVLKYLKGTIDFGVRYHYVKKSSLLGYSDSDWTECVDMKSTLGYHFNFGSEFFHDI